MEVGLVILRMYLKKVRAMHAVRENVGVLKRKSRNDLLYDYKEMLVNMEWWI